ncbi:MAG TPA: FAD-linked oxidase C-terminal domain-containing protein [Pyrinomonadaceae bacterium]|nr:FAD-linked oxidase C-terminal domain-containing protein [Pyrinomonadaceae bacterium]
MDTLIQNLRTLLGHSAVLSDPDELLVYECDGLPQHQYRPRAVVFPSSTEETSEVMRLLAREAVPFTPRGAGTGLSGGALALEQGVVIEFARMRKILKIDEANRLAVVQPGVVNLHVSRAVAHLGLHYVPDPSSQPTCTIGGNISENAGGIHCLKYGTTTDHVLGVRVVLAGGEIVELGNSGKELRGYDLLGTFVGSEGTFGVTTEATLRLVPIPPAVRTLLAEFPDVNDASHAVSAIIAAGVMPAALEMMDHEIIRAVEASVFAAGLPLDAGAALLIELDGVEAGIDEEAEQVKSTCLQYGARSCRLAYDENERKKLWAARKGAFGAIGRIAPDSMIQDAVVPRSRLPEVLNSVYRIATKYQLRIANVFHAGDGNLHPLICFDSRSTAEVQRVKEAGRELMETCVSAGGSITGEHGVGFDKRELLPLIFSDDDMNAMLRVRAAFDPTGLCNPGKIIPLLRGCGEARIASNVLPNPEPTSPATANLLGPRASRPQLRSRTAPTELHQATAQQRLAEIVGEEHVSEQSALPVIVSPDSIAEVREVMKLASSEGWKVTPAGAMTWLGRDVASSNLILSTQRLTRIIEHEPADLIAITEAGATLKNFNDTLKQRGQWLPLDPVGSESATIGGVIANGLGGAQQFGYGPPRRHVIGMKIVLADGSLIKAGGKVVKNVAGYDLCKLFTGSRGSLGLIVEANFKLRPVPLATTTVLVEGGAEYLLTMAREVIGAPLFPVAVELLSPARASEIGLSDGEHHLLLVRFAGLSTAVSDQARRAAQIFASGNNELGIESNDEPIWNALARASLPPDQLAVRISVIPVNLAKLLEAMPETGLSAWQAGVGDGRVQIVNHEGSNDNTRNDQVQKLRELVAKLNGNIVIENAPETLTQTSADGATGIMRRIKQQLDPAELLPPIPI